MKRISNIFKVCSLAGALAWAGMVNAKELKVLHLDDNKCAVDLLESYQGQPDSQGTLETFKLELPEYEKGVYYCGQWWPYAGNRVCGRTFTDTEGLDIGGMFLVLKLKDGRYQAILPLSGDSAYSYFAPVEGGFELKLVTNGNAPVKNDIPLICRATGDSPYEVCSKIWKKACGVPQIKGWMKMREQKTYPEMFKYLGWCSWEGYRKDISATKMTYEIGGLEASEVPVRYLLVDDGHFNVETLEADEKKFPNGYKDLTDLRSEDGIKWIGMWHAVGGGAQGMPKECPSEIADSMMECHNGRWLPKPDAESIETFMRYLLRPSVEGDIDFVKVDFCGTLLAYYAGTTSRRTVTSFPSTTDNAIGNPAEATALYADIYQRIVSEYFNGLMNCNWQTPQFIFKSGDCAVGRCSADYLLGSLKKAKSHLFDSYNKIPWLGQISWGDHDMFHSSDKFAGRMMAISKAMSGGPVYLSDKFTEIIPEHVMPLCYEDGLLLRPLAPASPVVDDIFMNLEDKGLYRAMAPLANKSAAFAVYNLHGDTESDMIEHTGGISAVDYCSASEMIQPYQGKWTIPEEGLVVYDHTTGKAGEMGDEYTFTLKGFSDRLIQISPITNGWAVIGRTDKYLSAAAVEVISADKEELNLHFREAGPFGIWLKEGKPFADGISFADHGNGYFVAELPVRAGDFDVTIKRGY